MAYKPLQASRLRTLVRIEYEKLTDNGRGGRKTKWMPLTKAWAEKIPMRGDEVLQDSVQRSVSTARFVIRHHDGVTTKHRLVEDASGKMWDIKVIDDPYGRRDRLELTCESGLAG